MKITFYKSKLWQGFAVSNLVAFTILGLNNVLNVDKGGILVFSEFVIIPLLIGIVSSWFWRGLELSGISLTLKSVLNATIAIFLSFVILKEGVICLIIVSPLIFAFVITGAFMGRSMFRKSNHTLNISVISFLLSVFIVDSISVHHYENLVSDEVLVKAPPSEVWKHVVSFEKIENENKYWLFQAGMPSPVQATVDGYYQGAGRKCIFSNGYTFDEKMVVYLPNKNLTFDITDQPRDPEIMGHIDIIRGQFLLKDNGDGTTTLTGKSWYRLYVFPIWYYDVWAESVTRNVHLRVMEHIKELSERH